jgi:Flp pilus assembly protein TadG
MMRTRLWQDRRGGTAVEFALIAPAFLSMIFLGIEGGRMIWMEQALKDVAFATARCMSVDGINCATSAQQKSFGVTRAGLSNIAITAGDVVIDANVVCDSNSNQNRVTVSKAFNSPVAGLFPAVPTTVSAYACFPRLIPS